MGSTQGLIQSPENSPWSAFLVPVLASSRQMLFCCFICDLFSYDLETNFHISLFLLMSKMISE